MIIIGLIINIFFVIYWIYNDYKKYRMKYDINYLFKNCNINDLSYKLRKLYYCNEYEKDHIYHKKLKKIINNEITNW